jgi:hypothetical protein
MPWLGISEFVFAQLKFVAAPGEKLMPMISTDTFQMS